MYRYDLHVHTAERSACARSFAEEMCQAALERGLAGIALTDHDVWWPDEEIEALRLKFPDLAILPGAEVALEEGHFLVFLPAGHLQLPYAGTVLELEDEVHAAGGILIWAHPFRYDRNHPQWLGRVRLDGLEVWSSNMNGETSARAAAVAERLALRRLRNSDAHDSAILGPYWNAMGKPILDERALIRALRTPLP